MVLILKVTTENNQKLLLQESLVVVSICDLEILHENGYETWSYVCCCELHSNTMQGIASSSRTLIIHKDLQIS